MHRLILIGHNGNADDIMDMLESLRKHGTIWEVIGYLDDAGPRLGCLRQVPWLGPVSDARRYLPASFVLAIGSERTYHRRQEIFHCSGLSERDLCTLIHPAAQVSQTARLDPGTVIHYSSYVGAYVRLETGVYIAPMVHIGHDSYVGAWSVLAPGVIVSGNVNIGTSVYIGAGAMIRDGVSIGNGSLIGMGAVITKDVPANSVVIGNPGRILRHIHKPHSEPQGSLVS
ncbi:MAG: NeuD/PglB/VioB family sugar acetyltransferase [Gemmatales bacterium]|nr:NeuD/PglB/VioB family sugar acetyltransferase [Gemmatales bacterium]